MTGSEDERFGTGRRGIDETAENREGRGGRTAQDSGSRDSLSFSTDFRVDILDHDDEVIVVAELPGAEEDGIRISLLNPHTLRITARRAGPVEERPRTYYIHERGNAILSRLIRLPASVMGEGAATSFKNGVLELRLKKVQIGPGRGGKEIPIG